MKRIMTAGSCALALAWSVVLSAPAVAQVTAPPELRNSKIIIDYVEPKSPEYRGLYERLKKRQALEELAQLLSPLRLPLALRLKFAECGGVGADYQPFELRVRICYELLQFMEERAPKAADTALGFITRSDAVIGSTVSFTLHEIGLALFDILEVPVLGKEEDAADQIAAFVMLQFGKDVARTTINGAAFAWATMASEEGKPSFSDVQSTPQQRLYTFSCIAYGSDPSTFQDYIEKGLLPKARAPNCKTEYEQVKLAFGKTILPHVDPDMMKLVQSRQWLRPAVGR
jgi:Putative metallopeptidase